MPDEKGVVGRYNGEFILSIKTTFRQQGQVVHYAYLYHETTKRYGTPNEYIKTYILKSWILLDYKIDNDAMMY